MQRHLCRSESKKCLKSMSCGNSCLIMVGMGRVDIVHTITVAAGGLIVYLCHRDPSVRCCAIIGRRGKKIKLNKS